MVVRSSHRCRTMPVAMAVLPRVAEALWHGKKSRDNVRQKNRRTRVGNKDWEVGNDRREGWGWVGNGLGTNTLSNGQIATPTRGRYGRRLHQRCHRAGFPDALASFSFLPSLPPSLHPLFPSFALSASRRKSIDRARIKKGDSEKRILAGVHTRTHAHVHTTAGSTIRAHAHSFSFSYFRVFVLSIRARLFAPRIPPRIPCGFCGFCALKFTKRAAPSSFARWRIQNHMTAPIALPTKVYTRPGTGGNAAPWPCPPAIFSLVDVEVSGQEERLRVMHRGHTEDIERKVPKDGHTERTRDSYEGREGT